MANILNLQDILDGALEVQNDIKNGKFQKDLSKILSDKQKRDFEIIAQKSVDTFYDSYRPRMYQRTGSLYSAYRINIEGADVYLDCKAEFMEKGHRVDDVNSEYIFDKIFMEGYHGGAEMEKGVMVPIQYKKGEEGWSPVKYNGPPDTPYQSGKWKWIPARQSDSPYSIIQDQMDKYYSGNSKNYSGNTFQGRIQEIKEYLTEKYRLIGLMRARGLW